MSSFTVMSFPHFVVCGYFHTFITMLYMNANMLIGNIKINYVKCSYFILFCMSCKTIFNVLHDITMVKSLFHN